MEDTAKALEALKLSRADDYSGRTPGRSTIYELKVKNGSTAYRYDVEVTKKVQKEGRPDKVLTKQNDPGLRTAQRSNCTKIIDALHSLTGGFGANVKFVYDGKKTLFTTSPVKLSSSTHTLKAEQLPKDVATFLRGDPVEISITPNEQVPKLDYSNFDASMVSDITEQADHSVRTFLELLTSQFPVNSGKYQMISAGTLFDTEVRDLSPGIQLRNGIKKGVRITRNNGQLTALLVADMKRTAFYAEKTVADIFGLFIRGPNDEAGKRKFEKHMRGVRCVVSYDTSRTFIFKQLSRDPLNSPRLNVRGGSLVDYMHSRGVQIRQPNWPGVHPDQPNGNQVVYPMEAIHILYGQLVPVEKLTDQASRQLLTENSLLPNDRYSYVQQRLQGIGAGDAAKFLAQFGVSVDISSNVIEINQRKTPKVMYGRNQIVTPAPNGSWFREAVDAPFIAPSNKLKNWIVAFDNRNNPAQIKQYITGLLARAKRAGMDVAPPIALEPTNLDSLRNVFEQYKDSCQFIFYIDDRNLPSHGRLKLFEAYYKVLTQHVISKNLGAGPQTLQNVLMKLNSKCFGLNYMPQFSPALQKYRLDGDTKDLLVIGLDSSHPTRATAKELSDLKKQGLENLQNANPTVVGVASNKAANPYVFAPDFFYQQNRQDAISPIRLANAVAQCVRSAQKFGRTPKRIIVIRDGLSEDQMEMAAKNELPAVRKGWAEGFTKTDATANLTPKVTFIVATKKHDKRFYRAANNTIANTGPGDVIDTKVTRSDVPEFYLQSHFPLKGVPKMPQYTVITNELDMTGSELQGFMNTLSNMHQVSACPTSLPLPVYCAAEAAKRGMEIYKEFVNMRRWQRDFAPEITSIANGIYDFDSLTQTLAYGTTKLANTRFNA